MENTLIKHPQKVKRTVYKVLNIFASLALIMNMSMVGVFLTPNEADAAAPVKDNFNLELSQWADKTPANWQHGNLNSSNSEYHEGESVPFMLELTNLTANTDYDIRVRYDFKKGDDNAYDYLTTYDRSRTPNPIPSGTPTTIAIPTDSGLSFSQVPGEFTLWDGTFVGTPTGPSTDVNEKYYDLTLHSTGTSMTLLWSGHLATDTDWGNNNGANSISGSPFHQAASRIIGDTEQSSQDRSIQPGAILPPPGECGLWIKKTAEINGTTITYTINYGNNGDANCTGGGVKIYDKLPSEVTYTGVHTEKVDDSKYDVECSTSNTKGIDFLSYSSNKNDPYQLSWNAHCVSPKESGTITFTAEVTTEPLVCGNTKITNEAWAWSTQKGNLDHVFADINYNKPCTYCGDDIKQTPNEMGTGGPLNDGNEECDGTSGTPDHYTCTDQCTLEYVPYCGDGIVNQTSEQCDDGNHNDTDACNNQCQTNTCDLEIVKKVDKTFANPGDTLTYTLEYKNKGTQTCTGGGVKIYDPLDNQITYVNDSRNIKISNDTEGDSYDPNQGNNYNGTGNTLLYNVRRVSPGESGTVTFKATVNDFEGCGDKEIPNKGKIWSDQTGDLWSNYVYTTAHKPCEGKLTVIKKVVGGDKVSSDWTMYINNAGGVVESFAGDVNGTTRILTTGDYKVTEGPAYAGWTLTYSGDCDADGNVNIAYGDDKTCTLTNTRDTGNLKVIKKVINNNGGTAVASDFTLYVKDGATNVADSPAAGSATGKMYNLETGVYNVSEDSIPGYTQTSIICDGQATDSVNVEKDKTKVCTITNDDKAPKITLIKKVINNNGGNAQPDDFKLTIGDVATTSGTAMAVEANKAYALNETQLSGYTFVSLTGDAKCPTKLGDTVTLDEGEHITCTITNDDKAPKIKLIKKVINNNGGNAQPDDFKLTIGGVSTLSGDWMTVDSNKPYALNETQLNGYSFVSLTGDAKCPSVLGGNVTLDEGEEITCTITNDDKAPRITLIKKVQSIYNGNAQPDDFKLTIGGIATTSGAPMNVEANKAYALNETQLSGYEFVSLTGDDKCPSLLGGTVTLDEGENITCTITNKDKAPKITLIKKVINNNGGNAQPDDFKLTIGGVSTFSGDAMTVDANKPYALDETQLSGYTFVSLTGDAKCPAKLGDTVTLDEGEHITCTITNDDKAPKITLIKKVQNNFNGNAKPDDFKLTIGGVATTSGTAMAVKANTAYALNETQLSGYEFVSLTGDAKCPSVLGGTVTLDEGENITCTITNQDKAPKITLIKDVLSGNAKPDDFKLTIGGNPAISGTTYPVKANTAYALNETQLNGYSFVSLTGDAKCPSVLGETVTLDEGENITCTIKNERDTGDLRIKKYEDTNGNGQKDSGEPYMTGWEFVVKQGTNLIANGHTGDDGDYLIINDLPTGSYDVTEILKTNWINTDPGTTPATKNVTVYKNQMTSVWFGNFELGKISGHKFNDLNGNGIWDAGEPTLSGWTINLHSVAANNTIVDTTITDENGFYEFDGLMADDYLLSETQQTGWIQTTVPHPVITIESGTDSQNHDFGNFEKGKISGHKFEDMNANGFWDEGEQPLNGWEICIVKTGLNFDKGFPTIANDLVPAPTCVMTGAGDWEDGYYEFTGLLAGTYSVWETNQAGWTQIIPIDPANYTVNINSGDVKTDNDFGNFKNVDVTVYKYMDANGSLADTNDWTAKEGWTVQLWKNTGENFEQVGDDQLTGADGSYTWTNLGPGEYKVTEVFDNTKFTALTTTEYTFTVTSGNDVEKVFGNFELGTIAGYKFEDVNNDGEWLTTEMGEEIGLEGWTINLWNDDEGQPGEIIASTTTNEFGYYEFNGLMAGTYYLSENLPDDWYQYAPEDGVHGPIVVTSGYDSNLQENYFLFGNAEKITLDLDKYNDQEVAHGGDGLLTADETVNYTIDWGVSGNSIATNVVLTDVIPEELNINVDSISDSGTWDATTRTITWDFGNQQPNTSGFVTYSATLALPITVETGFEIINMARISADNSDPEYVEDDSTVTVEIPKVEGEELPKLVITKDVEESFINPGDNVNYTVKVENIGEGDAINVMLQDLLPAGFTFEDGSVTKTWPLGDILAGEFLEVSYIANTNDSILAGDYDNLAVAWADNHGNVTDDANVEVRIPLVLGEELPTTGGSIMNFIYLFAAGLVLAFSLYMLRLTTGKKEAE